METFTRTHKSDFSGQLLPLNPIVYHRATMVSLSDMMWFFRDEDKLSMTANSAATEHRSLKIKKL